MAKFRTKIKGGTKGKRWPKGGSSSSNPQTTKFRDAASIGTFQNNTGVPSNLTTEAVRKHEAVQNYISRLPEAMDEDAASSTGTGTYKTMQSFASDWSGCSHMSFNRFLTVFRSDSALHKQMLAMLAAIRDTIVENGGSETSTEYYCSLLTTLQAMYNEDNKNEEEVTAVLALLDMGIRSVPEAVLRLHFSDVTAKLVHILSDYSNSENNQIIKSVFGILTTLMRKQELATWEHDSINQIFMMMLNPFCIHNTPKWRKSALKAVTLIVKADYFAEAKTNFAANKVAEYCIQVLETCMGGNSGTILVSSVQAGQTTILYILRLIKDTICHFSKPDMKKICEMVLRLLTLNYPLVTSWGLQVFHALFSAQTAVAPAKLNAQLISALYDYQPNAADTQQTLAWLTVMKQAHVHLSDVDLAMSCAALPKMFTTASQLWLSERPAIMTGVTNCLEILLKDAVAPACATKQLVEQHSSKLSMCFNTLELGLRLEYHSVWHQVLHLISVMFEVAGENCSHLLLGCLKTLADLRDSYKFSFNNELEYAVGAAIRSMGPEIVLNVISLKKENGDLNMDRSWLIPVLKENIKSSTIDFFIKGIQPIALFCLNRSVKLAESNDGIGAHSFELLYMQLWNLLICFCNKPSDIKENFKHIAKILGMAIVEKKELRLSVMAALRKLIASAKESGNMEDLGELARFGRNYLPILFNLYSAKPMGSDEEGQRLAALDTIKVYLSIAYPEVINDLIEKAHTSMGAPSDHPEDHFRKESILDLIRALIPYISEDDVKKVYTNYIKPLPQIENRKEQKKAYRLMEEICASKSDGCKNFITSNRKEMQKLLKSSLACSAVCSKGARLRCLGYLVRAQPQLDYESKLIRSVVSEAVLSCKDVNVKTRSIAFEMLNIAGETLQNHNQIDRLVAMILDGIKKAESTQEYASCAILALASILNNFSGSLGYTIQELLDKVEILSRSTDRPVASACLTFVKVYLISVPTPMVAAAIPQIMKCLTGMTEDCQRHCRLKVRDILDKLLKKFGYDSLSPHVPLEDKVMYKRLRNLRKIHDRKRKMKESMKDDESVNDEFLVNTKSKSFNEILASSSDEDSEDDEPAKSSEKSKKKIQTWIEEDDENIVDFTDPTVAKKITASKPGGSSQTPFLQASKEKKKDRGFKTAPDGRLIIKDDSSSDSEDEKDAKIEFKDDYDSASDEEKKSVAETLVLGNRKRKRSGAASVKSNMSGRSSQPPVKYRPGGSGIHRATSASSIYSRNSLGSEYKPKKAKGDMKKKGKHEPYAYLPLTAVSKRNRISARKQFKNIVKTKVRKGKKGKKPNK